jgi:Uma2 family endonuclease
MRPALDPTGPYRSSQLGSGDPYELSRGHLIQCLPTGARGSEAVAIGAAVLKSDPAVEELGVDTGYSPRPDSLRAPDLAVGNVPQQPGWVEGVPRLAVEYADTGQNEADLKVKIAELLEAGTQLIWVVRLNGPRRVEIHEANRQMRLAHAGDLLQAPGILANPVPVEALYDREAGRTVTLRNLLQREGFADLEAVKQAGENKALREAILEVLGARGLSWTDDFPSVLETIDDSQLLRVWLGRAATTSSLDDVIKQTD